MAYYALMYEVVDDYVAQRAAFRDEHLTLVRAAHECGELPLAGALGDPVEGALLIFRAADRAVVADFVERDPYVRHGLVTRWTIRPWAVVIGGE